MGQTDVSQAIEEGGREMKKATKQTAKPKRKTLITGEITKDPILSPIFDTMLNPDHKPEQQHRFATIMLDWSARQITNEPPRAPYEREFWDQWFNELPRFAERLTEGGPLVELMLAVLKRIAMNSPHMDEGEYRYWCRWLQDPRSDRLAVSDTILTKSVDRFLSETGQSPIVETGQRPVVRFVVVPSPTPAEPSKEFSKLAAAVLHASENASDAHPIYRLANRLVNAGPGEWGYIEIARAYIADLPKQAKNRLMQEHNLKSLEQYFVDLLRNHLERWDSSKRKTRTNRQ